MVYQVEWVPIATPDQGNPGRRHLLFNQGLQSGRRRALPILKAAGTDTGGIYIVSTSGGGPSAQVPGGQGQVWVYEPATETLSLLFQSPGAEVLNAPDNICVSPRGGLVLCEDGSGEGIRPRTDGGRRDLPVHQEHGAPERRAATGLGGRLQRQSEFAGACYSPDGDWLFVNIQSPGITFAISGPWKSGAL